MYTGTTVCRIYQCFTIHEMGKQRKINRYAMPAASLLLKSVCIIPFVYVCLSICLYIKPPPLVLFLWTVVFVIVVDSLIRAMHQWTFLYTSAAVSLI